MQRSTMRLATDDRHDALVAGLADELMLPPVWESLLDLAAGLDRLCVFEPRLQADPDIALLRRVAGSLAKVDDGVGKPRLVLVTGWSRLGISGGLLGDVPVTPAAAAFAARCDATWLADYCADRSRIWRDLGRLAEAVERAVAPLAESWRSVDDDHVEALAEIETDSDAAVADAIAARVRRLSGWRLDAGSLAAWGGFSALRPGTLVTLARLERRLRDAARLLAQVTHVRPALLRTLAYGEVDQLVLDSAIADLWRDLWDAAVPATPADAEAAVVAVLRDVAVIALADAVTTMAISVVAE